MSRPADLRALSAGELDTLATEIRAFLVEHVGRTGGHLGPNLGVVELTIALHRVFDSPKDTLLWDTGHQAYVHKILTGRREAFDTLRQPGGLSGYPSRSESEHDFIESSHASSALSWADGVAKAFELTGTRDRHVVVVVGDGALTGGMCWEALNNIGSSNRPVVVVVNDNGRSYSPTVGGLAEQLAALRAPVAHQAPHPEVSHRPRGIFADLGLTYLGPVDGHDIDAVETTLRKAIELNRPVVVHCVTAKGRGHDAAEADSVDRMHAIPPSSASTTTTPRASWTGVFAAEMIEVGRERPDVVGITAAMLHPVGLAKFARAHPDRIFDVGIAEQHAVASAAGLAFGGLHPVVAIYSTFMNRAFDQVLMDVALHRAGVTFVLDRAGITGDDGPSHNGMWDLSLLRIVPGIRIAAPRDAVALCRQLREALAVSDGPTVLRFPKGPVGQVFPALDCVGNMEVLYRNGKRSDGDVLIVSVGPMAEQCLSAAELLTRDGMRVTVVDPGWVIPVDDAMAPLAAEHRLVVTVEDSGRGGGVGSAVAQAIGDAGIVLPVRNIGIPQEFLAHGKRPQVLAEAGLTGADIYETVRAAMPGLRPDRSRGLVA